MPGRRAEPEADREPERNLPVRELRGIDEDDESRCDEHVTLVPVDERRQMLRFSWTRSRK